MTQSGILVVRSSPWNVAHFAAAHAWVWCFRNLCRGLLPVCPTYAALVRRYTHARAHTHTHTHNGHETDRHGKQGTTLLAKQTKSGQERQVDQSIEEAHGVARRLPVRSKGWAKLFHVDLGELPECIVHSPYRSRAFAILRTMHVRPLRHLPLYSHQPQQTVQTTSSLWHES